MYWYILLFEDVCIIFCWSYYLMLNSSYSGCTDYPVIFIIEEEEYSSTLPEIPVFIMVHHCLVNCPQKHAAILCLISVSSPCSFLGGLCTFCSSPSFFSTLCCFATRSFRSWCWSLSCYQVLILFYKFSIAHSTCLRCHPYVSNLLS